MKDRGFTLIEIIVSVTLLLLLSGLLIANYNGFNSTQTVRQSSLDVISNLQAARTMASAGVKPADCDTLIGYIVAFNANGSTYTTSASCNNGSYLSNTYILPTGVTFDPVPDSVTFYTLGGRASADQTISVVGNGVTMNVSVFTSGEISEYNPLSTPAP